MTSWGFVLSFCLINYKIEKKERKRATVFWTYSTTIYVTKNE